MQAFKNYVKKKRKSALVVISIIFLLIEKF